MNVVHAATYDEAVAQAVAWAEANIATAKAGTA